jgi:hypothetical protein
MPRPARLPTLDLRGIAPVELQLAVLSVLEEHGFDAERRQRIIGENRARLIDLIDDCDEAISRIRRR